MKVQKSYKIELNPNNKQKTLLRKHSGVCQKEDVDSADYWIVGGKGVSGVEVRRAGWSEIKVVDVETETEIIYNVTFRKK